MRKYLVGLLYSALIIVGSRRLFRTREKNSRRFSRIKYFAVSDVLIRNYLYLNEFDFSFHGIADVRFCSLHIVYLYQLSHTRTIITTTFRNKFARHCVRDKHMPSVRHYWQWQHIVNCNSMFFNYLVLPIGI